MGDPPSQGPARTPFSPLRAVFCAIDCRRCCRLVAGGGTRPHDTNPSKSAGPHPHGKASRVEGALSRARAASGQCPAATPRSHRSVVAGSRAGRAPRRRGATSWPGTTPWHFPTCEPETHGPVRAQVGGLSAARIAGVYPRPLYSRVQANHNASTRPNVTAAPQITRRRPVTTTRPTSPTVVPGRRAQQRDQGARHRVLEPVRES